MQLSRNKTTATSIALLLIATIAVTMLALPTANAHDPPWYTPTYAFLSASPSPIGVDQDLFVNFWLDKVPPTANVAFGDRWENLKVEVTKPDGSMETLGPFRTDDVGAAHTIYTPNQIGTYKFKFVFPGQTIAGANPNPVTGTNNVAFVGDYYQPSNSSVVEVIVQEEQITPWPVTPLPTDYWTRPINGMNPEWARIAGDWLMGDYNGQGNYYNPFTTAPESAHIAWTYPIAAGGVAGGNFTDWNYYTGLAYETKMGSAFIMNGKLYLNLRLSTGSGGGAVCLDLRTGEQIWYQNNVSISYGQNYNYISPNQFGVIQYLWQTGSTYHCFDPWTGRWLFSLANASLGGFGAVTNFGPNGELLVYNLNGAQSTLTKWNSTKAIMYYQQPGVLPGGNVWQWRPMMQTVMDWTKGIEWTVTTKDYKNMPGNQGIKKITDDVILATTVNAWSIPYTSQMEIGYSTKDGRELWAVNRTLTGGLGISWNTLQGSPAGEGVYTEFHPETMTWEGFDIYTGNKLWGPTKAYPNAFGMYSWQARIGYGKLFAADYGGYVHAYNLETGETEWDFFAGSSGLNTVYPGWPFNTPMAIADGKVYATTGHAYNPPLFKGAKVYCINATDGTLIWDILGFYNYNGIAIADGYLVLYNNYDGQVYCYGKGPSATTVTASPKVSVHGSSVLIEGTVTDQSAGQTCLGTPAAGTPAVSDDSQGRWMEYLYMQQQCPANGTGVEVTLDALDPNGNFVHIGTATSDISGMFKKAFVPEVPGEYTIIATFAGSKSYGSSYAETAINVDVAPPPTEEPQYPQPIDPTWTIIGVGIVLLIAIAIIGLLILRKK